MIVVSILPQLSPKYSTLLWFHIGECSPRSIPLAPFAKGEWVVHCSRVELYADFIHLHVLRYPSFAEASDYVCEVFHAFCEEFIDLPFEDNTAFG